MRAVPVLVLFLAPAISIAQERAPVGASEIPPAWRRAIAAREVRMHVEGAGDWDEPEDTWRRILVLERAARSERTSDVAREPETLSVDARHCATALRALRDHAPVRRIGEAPLRLSIALGRIALGARTVRSIDDELCEPVMPGDGSRPSIAVLSLVGPVLSLSEWSSEHRAGGPPYHSESWPTIHVRTGAPVAITDVVGETSLLDALRRDQYLRDRAPAILPELANAATWAEAVTLLARAELTAGGFAFVDWHEERRVAGVRLALHPRGCGMCPNSVVTLGLEVSPRPALVDDLRAARAGRGHLLAHGEIDTL